MMTTIMTNEEIIRMAREAGAIRRYWGGNKEGFAFESDKQLERFANIVAEVTRVQLLDDADIGHYNRGYYVGLRDGVEVIKEKAAKVCENLPQPKDATTLTHIPTIETCAAAIRSMK